MSPTGWGWLVLSFPLAGTIVISLLWRRLPGRTAGYIGTGAIWLAFAAAVGALISLQGRVPADRTVTDECRDVRRGMHGLGGVKVVAEATPCRWLLVRIPARHPVRIGPPGERPRGRSTVSDDDRGDPLSDRARHVGIHEGRQVGMVVHVDEARCQHQTVGVDRPR